MTGTKRPHIVIFNPDQWRGDVLGHMGNPAAVTPVLDSLAETDAISFRNAFCQNPVCTPSRCSFMSGWYPHVRGHRTMHHMMAPDEPVLLKQLKDSGYFVWWGGKNDLVPGEGGFDAYCDVKFAPTEPITPGSNLHAADGWRGEPGGDNYYSFFAGKCTAPQGEEYIDEDWALVRGAIEFLEHAPQDRPLCIYLPLLYPHPPYGVESPYYECVDRDALPPRIPAPDWEGKPSLLRGIWERQGIRDWSEERFTELRAVYYGMCTRVDAQLGMLLDALKRHGMYDDTALFFFSDHGDFTGDYSLVEKTQNTFEDCLTRVPFLIKPPAWAGVQPGVSDALVELIDFCATAQDWAGIQPDYTHFGRSLGALVRGDATEHRDAVFCEGGRRRGEYQASEHENLSPTPDQIYWPRLSLQAFEGEPFYHSKGTMLRTKDFKYVARIDERDELYDLHADPGETVNRIDDPSLAGELAKLRERMLRFYIETGDQVPIADDEHAFLRSRGAR